MIGIAVATYLEAQTPAFGLLSVVSLSFSVSASSLLLFLLVLLRLFSLALAKRVQRLQVSPLFSCPPPLPVRHSTRSRPPFSPAPAYRAGGYRAFRLPLPLPLTSTRTPWHHCSCQPTRPPARSLRDGSPAHCTAHSHRAPHWPSLVRCRRYHCHCPLQSSSLVPFAHHSTLQPQLLRHHHEPLFATRSVLKTPATPTNPPSTQAVDSCFAVLLYTAKEAQQHSEPGPTCPLRPPRLILPQHTDLVLVRQRQTIRTTRASSARLFPLLCSSDLPQCMRGRVFCAALAPFS